VESGGADTQAADFMRQQVSASDGDLEGGRGQEEERIKSLRNGASRWGARFLSSGQRVASDLRRV
jgi:hypothetical protein